MPTITDIIVLIHPASDAQGIAIKDTVWVLFNQEIDEASINEGNLLIEGPDTDSFIGPDMGMNLPNVSDSGDNDQLASPGYKGIVPGTISFKKINLTDLNPYTGPPDTTGAGNLWRTKVIFTPAFAFQTVTTYRVYIAGDEDVNDDTPTGVRARSVFDTVALGGNTGTGNVLFTGTYTGTIADTYHINITIAGPAGEAWYEWFKTSDTTPRGPILSDAYFTQTLENNVTVKFGSGDFLVDDEFTVAVTAPQVFADNTYWDFTTGSGAIVQPPTSTSTSVTGDPVGLVPMNFTVVSMIPADRSTNLPVTTNRIVLNFNDNLDPSTVTSDTVTVMGQPVNGDETALQTRVIYKDITVSGKKIIIDI